MNITDADPQAISGTATEPEADNETTTEPGTGSGTTGPGTGTQTTTGPGADSQTGPRPAAGRRAWPRTLYRPADDRMLAGVAAGIACYLGVDVLVVRLVLAVLTVVGGAGLPIYLAGWLLIPEEGSDQSIASELIQSLSVQWH